MLTKLWRDTLVYPTVIVESYLRRAFRGVENSGSVKRVPCSRLLLKLCCKIEYYDFRRIKCHEGSKRNKSTCWFYKRLTSIEEIPVWRDIIVLRHNLQIPKQHDSKFRPLLYFPQISIGIFSFPDYPGLDVI